MYSRTITTYSRDEIRLQQVQWQFQLDIFQRDQAIAQDEKRCRDGVYIRALTSGLAEALPVPERSPTVLVQQRPLLGQETDQYTTQSPDLLSDPISSLVT